MSENRIVVTDLALRRGGLTILKDVNLSIGPGIVLLTGANGSGKSTLLRALAGVLPPAHGSVVIDGFDLWRQPVAARRRLGHLPDTPDLFPYLTARELLRTANAVRGLDPEVGHELFCTWVRPQALDLRIGALSTGQRRKLALVTALAHEPPVLLLDEPTNALDSASIIDLTARMVRLGEAGHTIVIASHRPDQLDVPIGGRLTVADNSVHQL